MTGGVIVHNFQQQLDRSQTLSDEESWRGFYECIWPGQIICTVRIDKDSVWQRWGVDREVKLSTGQQFTIDEKKRETDYGDMLIEEISQFYGENNPRNRIGWTLDKSKRCDFVAYAIVPTSRCWLLPFDLLRRTARVYLPEWRLAARATRRLYPVIAKNRGYATKNCPVAWDRLWTDMRRVSEQRYGGDLKLPAAFTAKEQLWFDWSAKPTKGEK